MKILKLIILLLFLSVLSVFGLYLYGPESIKQELDKGILALNLESYAEKALGRKIQKRSLDEVMTKNQTFYTWKDMDGGEHYADSLKQVPPEARSKVQKVDSDKIGGSLELMSKEEEGAMLKRIEKTPPPEHLKTLNYQILIYTYQGNEELSETKNYFDMYNMPYTLLDVVANPEYASQLKIKMGLDINQKYQLPFPVIEINGELIPRIVLSKDKQGNPVRTAMDKEKINKIFGLRSTFE